MSIIINQNKINPLCGSDVNKESFTHDTYPEQDLDYIGKKVRVKTKNRRFGNVIFGRLEINRYVHPEYTGEREILTSPLFEIVRFDKKENGVCILLYGISVVVCKVEDIKELYYYEGYEREQDELELKELPWDEFNERYPHDKIHILHNQNYFVIDKPVYVEYYKDIFTHDKEENLLHRELINRPKDLKEYMEKLEKKFHDHMYPLDTLSKEWIRSFTYYYNNHNKSFEDYPRMVLEQGIMICSDTDNTNTAHDIVKVVNEGTKYDKYILNTEATFYIDADDIFPHN